MGACVPTEGFAGRLTQVPQIIEQEACADLRRHGWDSDLARIEAAYRQIDAAGMDSRAFSEP